MICQKLSKEELRKLEIDKAIFKRIKRIESEMIELDILKAVYNGELIIP